MTPLESVRARIAEASRELEHIVCADWEPGPRDALGWPPCTRRPDRLRLLSWLSDLRAEEAQLTTRRLAPFLKRRQP